MSRRAWQVVTPSGIRVMGQRGDDREAVGDAYAKLFETTWASLERRGYRLVEVFPHTAQRARAEGVG